MKNMLYTYSLWHLTSLAYVIYSWRVFKNIKILKIYITHDFKFLLLDHFKSISPSLWQKKNQSPHLKMGNCLSITDPSPEAVSEKILKALPVETPFKFPSPLPTLPQGLYYIWFLFISCWEYKTSREFRGNMNNIKDLDSVNLSSIGFKLKIRKI